MQYTENDIKEGTKLICTKATICWWTTAKVYEVSLGKDGILFIKDDQGHDAYVGYMLDCLNGKHNPVEFEIIKEEEQMQYTENDLKDGMKLICTQDGGFDWWTKGGIYTVANKCILDNFGDSAESGYILDSLNNESSFVKFEIFEYPTATITVDVEQRLNDKIEVLSTERENILAKMDRMEKQQLKLRNKVQKLHKAKKALKTLREFM